MFSTLLTGLLCNAFFTCIQQTLLHVSNNVKKFLQYNINICVLTLVPGTLKKIYISKGTVIKMMHVYGLLETQIFFVLCTFREILRFKYHTLHIPIC